MKPKYASLNVTKRPSEWRVSWGHLKFLNEFQKAVKIWDAERVNAQPIRNNPKADGPPVEPKDKESKFKSAVNYTKQTAMKLLKSLKRRFLESSDSGVIDSLRIPINSTDPSDVKESLGYAKEIIQGSKDLYDIEGRISLKNDDINKYITG